MITSAPSLQGRDIVVTDLLLYKIERKQIIIEHINENFKAGSSTIS